MRRQGIVRSLCAVAMTVGGVALGSAPAYATITNPFRFVHIQNAGSGKCVDGGPPVEQWRCLNTSFEEWEFLDAGNENYQIFSQASRECLAQPDSDANGTPVVEEFCAQQPSQLWHAINGTLSGGSDFQLLNLSSGQCLDLENGDTSDGVPMQVWDCDPRTSNQRWHRL